MKHEAMPRRESHDAGVPTHKDPVCGMDVLETSAFGKLDHDGQPFYFCSEHCLNRFKAEPAKYAKRQSGSSSRF